MIIPNISYKRQDIFEFLILTKQKEDVHKRLTHRTSPFIHQLTILLFCWIQLADSFSSNVRTPSVILYTLSK